MNIKSPEAEALARQVAGLTGDTLTGAILTSLRERLAGLEARANQSSLADSLDAIALRAAALPLADVRSPEEILDYNQKGLPR